MGREWFHVSGVRGSLSPLARVYRVSQTIPEWTKAGWRTDGASQAAHPWEAGGLVVAPRWGANVTGVSTQLPGATPGLRTLGFPELKYFRHGRRKAGESMSDYVTRKCEMYLRAQQALQPVKPHHGDNGSANSAVESSAWGRCGSQDGEAAGTPRRHRPVLRQATAIPQPPWQPRQLRQRTMMMVTSKWMEIKAHSHGATTTAGGWLLESVARELLPKLANAQPPQCGSRQANAGNSARFCASMVHVAGLGLGCA